MLKPVSCRRDDPPGLAAIARREDPCMRYDGGGGVGGGTVYSTADALTNSESGCAASGDTPLNSSVSSTLTWSDEGSRVLDPCKSHTCEWGGCVHVLEQCALTLFRGLVATSGCPHTKARMKCGSFKVIINSNGSHQRKRMHAMRVVVVVVASGWAAVMPEGW
jgi:hypothetical protein